MGNGGAADDLRVYRGRITGARARRGWAALSRDDPDEPVAAAAFDLVERRIVDYIGAGDGRSTAEIAAHAGLSTRATQHRLAALAERRLVVVVGSGPHDPRRRWYVTGKNR